MAARRYLCPYLPGLSANAPPFPGAALRFGGAGGGGLLPVFADAELTTRLANPVRPDCAGRFPDIFLDDRLAYRVDLLASTGSELASHLILAQAAGMATAPDDAGLFKDLGRIAIPPGVTRIRTEGWAVRGLGAGDYVSDALATPAFAARHPRFCAITANRRVFRLLGEGGLITVEQGGAWGDPQGQHRVNDQPAFQAAIDYVREASVSRIGMAQSGYSLWVTKRSLVTGIPRRVHDGHGLVIAPGQRVHLVGLAATRPRLAFRAPGGRSFEGTVAGTNFQMVEGKAWRGAGFFLPGSEPGSAGRQSLTLERLVIDGGTRRSARVRGTGNATGWDTSHKGIWVQPDRKGGDIAILDCEMTGWRGETVYTANNPEALLMVRNSVFANSSAQGLNPNGCRVDIDGCVIRDCRIGIEGWTGPAGGRIMRTEIVDCRGLADETGSAFALQGGVHGRSERSTYFKPTRSGQAGNPVGRIDITCRDSASAHVGWWLAGRLVLVDTTMVLGEPWVFGEGTSHVDLDVELVTRATNRAFIEIAGGKGRKGDRLTDHVRLRVTSRRASDARVGRGPQSLVVWRGSLGPDIRIRLRGEGGARPPHALRSALDSEPVFE